MNRRLVVGMALAALSLGATTVRAVDPASIERGMRATSYVESAEMLFDVRSGGHLSLGTTSGSIDIRTWPRDQIRLVVTKWTQAGDVESARRILDMFSVRANNGGRHLKLHAAAKTQECANAVGVEFKLWVPKSCSLDIKTHSGSIKLPQVDGAFSAHTGDGTITVDCETEDLDVEVEDRSQSSDDPARNRRGSDGREDKVRGIEP